MPILTKTKVIDILAGHLPAAKCYQGRLINAIFPDDFDLIAEEISGTPDLSSTSRDLDFVQAGHMPNTRVYAVYHKKGGHMIGQIRWHGHSYSYAFFPLPDTIYDILMLSDVARFIEALMILHYSRKRPISSPPVG